MDKNYLATSPEEKSTHIIHSMRVLVNIPHAVRCSVRPRVLSDQHSRSRRVIDRGRGVERRVNRFASDP